MFPAVLVEPRLRPVRLVALVGVAYCLAGHFSSELARITSDVAAVWLANGIALAALLVWAPIYRTRFVLGVGVAVVAGSLLEAGSATTGIGFAIANLAEVLVAAAILRRAGVASSLLGSVRNVLLFVPTVALAAAVGASLGSAAVAFAYGEPYWSVWPGWWVAGLLGHLIVVPLLTAWVPWSAPRLPGALRVAELGFLLAGTGATAFAAFDGLAITPLLWPLLLFLTVPFQIWAAVRFDRRVATATSLLILLGGMAALGSGASFPVAGSLSDGLLLLQAVLALTSINAMTLSAAINQRQRAETGARSAEARLRHAVDSMSDGFELYDAHDRLELYNDRGRDLLPELADVLVAGTPFETIVRASVDRGLCLDAIGRSEEWIGERLRHHRGASEDYEMRLDGGRWLLVRERRTSDGGTVIIRADITHLKQREQIRLQEIEERRRRAEAERLAEVMRESEAVSRGVLDTALDAYVRMDQDGRITEWNVMAERTFGWTRSEAIGRSVDATIVPPAHRQAHRAGLTRFLAAGEAAALDRRMELQALHRSGREFPVELTIVALDTDRGKVFSAFIRDLTEKKRTEEQFRQMQKMEAVGQLTGGVAHDFNNLLAVIIGSLDLADERRTGDPALADHLSRALTAAEKGAALTHRLLAFSRQQALQPSDVDLNETVTGMIDLLRRTVGEQVEVETRLGEDTWPARVDKSQVESALLNLAINSRDAMPDGGRLVVGTANVTLDADHDAAASGMEPGDYVTLAVTDTGTGMPPEVIERVFEPFFTTKGIGKGSGLGLSMIYGFARQSGGHLKIYSEVGHGTTVRLYLPRMRSGAAGAVEVPPAPAIERPGDATVLVVEDSPAVRTVVVRQLSTLGYHVLEAEDAAAALGVLADDRPIDLLFTDIVMPGGMSGLQLAERAEQLRPGMRILFTSGFADPVAGPTRHRLLSKPYRAQDLARSVWEALA